MAFFLQDLKNISKIQINIQKRETPPVTHNDSWTPFSRDLAISKKRIDFIQIIIACTKFKNDILANGPIDKADKALPMLAMPIADGKSSLKLSEYTIGPFPGIPPAKIPYATQAAKTVLKDWQNGKHIMTIQIPITDKAYNILLGWLQNTVWVHFQSPIQANKNLKQI